MWKTRRTSWLLTVDWPCVNVIVTVMDMWQVTTAPVWRLLLFHVDRDSDVVKVLTRREYSWTQGDPTVWSVQPVPSLTETQNTLLYDSLPKTHTEMPCTLMWNKGEYHFVEWHYPTISIFGKLSRNSYHNETEQREAFLFHLQETKDF